MCKSEKFVKFKNNSTVEVRSEIYFGKFILEIYGNPQKSKKWEVVK